MSTVQLTQETFNETVRDNGIVLIDFWAEWCGPCRMFGPVYEEVSTKHEDVVFAKVDTESEQELAGAFQITSIPTLMAVREGVVLYSQAGALPQADLEKLVTAIKEVDMEKVHADITAEQAKQPPSE